MAGQGKSEPLRIGWIGNSYIYFNDLPSMVAEMVAEAGTKVISEQVTVGGQSLKGHTQDPKVEELLAKEWDIVVLQDMSALPGGANPEGKQESLRVIQEFFVPRIKSCTTVLLYSTWGHLNGSRESYPQFTEHYPDFPTMQRKTTEGYVEYSKLFKEGTTLVKAGDAFLQVYQSVAQSVADPLSQDSLFFKLYAPDTFHPSRIGSYLVSCVFFKSLTGKSPKGLKYIPTGCAHDEVSSEQGPFHAYSHNLTSAVIQRLKDKWSSKYPEWKPLEVTPAIALQLQQIADSI